MAEPIQMPRREEPETARQRAHRLMLEADAAGAAQMEAALAMFRKAADAAEDAMHLRGGDVELRERIRNLLADTKRGLAGIDNMRAR